MRHAQTSLLALVVAGAPGLVQAQAFDLGEIVVSANLEAAEADRSGATVIVVDAADLNTAGDIAVIDFVNRLPGVTIRPTGPLGAQTGISIRGASQNYVPVLIDGIKVGDPSAPQVAFNFGGLTTAGIGRIEILKGSQSALYGSDAIGGVINITTRRAEDEGLHHFVAAEYGSFETRRLSYSLTSRDSVHEFAATFAHASADGFSAADENDGNTEPDGFRANRLSFNGAYTLDNGVRIGASGFFEDSFSEFDESFPAIADGTPDEFNNNRTRGLRVFADFATGAVDHTVALSYFDIDRESNSDGFASLFSGSREKLSYQAATDIGASTRLVFGADTTRERSSDSFGFSGSNRINGAFAEARIAVSPAFDLTGSIRHDDHSRFDGFTSARLAAAWRAGSGTVVRGSIGRGFRAPSNFELFSSFGDPGLAPERSLTLDLGVERSFGERVSLRATGFHLEVDDLIDFDFASAVCGSGFGCFAQVPGTSRRSGVEIEGTFTLSDRVDLGLGYTYTDSSTNASSAWARVPRHDLVVSLAAEITPQLRGIIVAQHVAGREGLSDYTLVNTTLSYDFGHDREAYLRVENLFDEQYQLVPGFGTSDRALYAGIRTRF